MNPPKLTFLVPVKDTRSDWLSVALGGLARQTYPNVDICVGDNGSTRASTIDTIQAATERWPDKFRVNWLPKDGPKGTAYALDGALRMAESDTKYFCKADSDDMFHPKWIENRMKVVETLPEEVSIVYDNYMALQYQPRPHIIPVILRPYDYRALLYESYIPGPSMYRASVYDRIPRTYVYDGYEGRANKHGEDLNHWLAITDCWDAFWIDSDPATTWTYRVYADSKYHRDRKGVDYARTLLQRRAAERRGLA